jgi:SAM-dependent methyltransferase
LTGARPVEDGTHENAYVLREADGSLDFVFSSHTLEHLDRPWDALSEWIRVLKPGGVLFLYLPHPACEMWKPERLRFHRWSPDPVTLEEKLSVKFALQPLYVSYLPDAYFSFVVIAQKAIRK